MDKSAFEQKARTWHLLSLSVGHRCGAGNEEAEDIAQDVMLHLWQMRDELEKYHSVEALVALMTRHLVRNHQRRRSMEPLKEETVTLLTESPQELLETKENEEWLTKKLGQLPTTQRTLLYMRQVERRSHEEIARLLDIKVSSVSTLLARARKALLEDIKKRYQI
ncbi:MAG: sigma-70 family RNA polymerase sigma factor [Prevotella sp.]|nr:sigma-70 family RNA polymerase sigma factor [Prevotella sp.]